VAYTFGHPVDFDIATITTTNEIRTYSTT